ncbi:HAD-IA family hydrolase [Bradyrhizobium sp.]|uniref:HAD-IA family hydrolase n=1 Tax=Bradyrhizobium sp. TaxID=376 RepID=UPI0026109936|nr:HAD-IA family hydrolase [Bradyrhizobium sp.]
MNVETLSVLLRPRSLKDRIADAAVLILDVDGTLAETEGIHRRAFNAAFIEAGFDWYWDQRTYKKLLRTTGGKERIQAFGRTRYPGICLSDSEVAKLHRTKTRHYGRLIAQHTCRLRPGVAALIRNSRARGQTLAIATTTTYSNIDELLSVALEANWCDLFATVVAGDDVARKKPAPDVYLEVLARLGYGASECLAIEDSANGLKAASSAGIPVLISRSEYFRDDDFSGALAVVDDLTELG